MTDLQIRVQNVRILNIANGYHAITHQTRENFKASRDDIQSLMRRMLEVRQTVRSSMIHHPSSSFLIAES